jgi:hypothetical protein
MRKLGMAGNPYMAGTNQFSATRKVALQGVQGLL